MGTATSTMTETRTCHNCGRPQDHRIHDGAGHGTLPNGCFYIFAQPLTLWEAVLRPALQDAAERAGVDSSQAFRATYDAMHRH